MHKHGDKYQNALGHEAELTTPMCGTFKIDSEDYCLFTYGAIVRICGMVIAHVGPWPDSEDNEFQDEQTAAERGDALLKTLGFHRVGLPQFKDGQSIDITGGMDSAEYVRQMRDDD